MLRRRAEAFAARRAAPLLSELLKVGERADLEQFRESFASHEAFISLCSAAADQAAGPHNRDAAVAAVLQDSFLGWKTAQQR